jgi:hypothetical protein
MKEKTKEENILSNPGVSIRMDPEMQQRIKDATGKSTLAEAVRYAVERFVEDDTIINEIDVFCVPKSSLSSLSSNEGTFIINKGNDELVLINVAGAKKMLGISTKGVHKKIKRGQLRAIKPAKEWLVYVEDLEKLLKPKVERVE